MYLIDKFSIYLNGYMGDRDYNVSLPQNKATKLYFNRATLAILTGAGIVIAAAGVLAFLTVMGHLPALAAFLPRKCNSSSHT